MRPRLAMVISAVLAAAAWAGLVYFVNNRMPSLGNEFILIGLWFAALASSFYPLILAINARIDRPVVDAATFGRSAREALLIAGLGAVLLTLQLLRQLNLFTGIIFTTLAVLAELLCWLHRRRP